MKPVRHLLIVMTLLVGTPVFAQKELVPAERVAPGWAMVAGGALTLVTSQTGLQRTRDANERFLYYSFQALSTIAIGYGLHQVYGISEFNAFKSELDLLELPPETRQTLLEIYLRSTQRAEQMRQTARGLSLVATGVLLLLQSTNEEHAKTKTALGVASGLSLLGGLTLTF